MVLLLTNCGPIIFPTAYATNTVAAITLFFVAPATLLPPNVMMRLTTGPKNPVSAYPTTGTAGWYPHFDFQIMTHPAITGRQQTISMGMRVFGSLVGMYPHSGMKMRHMPPTGNWKRIESRVL